MGLCGMSQCAYVCVREGESVCVCVCACVCVVMMEETSIDKQENWLRTSCVDGFVWHESMCV